MVGDETVIFNTETKEAHCLNALAGFVFANADGQSTMADLAERATAKLARDVSVQELNDAVVQLRGRSLLDEPFVVLEGTSRREVMKRFAYASAAVTAASTMITSIVAPAAAAVTTPIPVGCPGCTQNKDCHPLVGCPGGSGHCCTNPNQTCAALLGCCADCNNSCALATVNGVSVCTVCLPIGQCPTSCPGGAAPCPCRTSIAC